MGWLRPVTCLSANMYVRILFMLCFFIFTNTIHSKKNSCPNSHCETRIFLPIKYPFKLENDPLPKDLKDHIDLKCDDQGNTIINLPSAGEFGVSLINYFSKEIILSDPQDCLPKRLMSNLSFSPLEAIEYENFTFFTCPKYHVEFSFDKIPCLSNSTNSTIAIADLPAEFMEGEYGCKPIVSSLIPVTPTRRKDWESGELQLTWNVSRCHSCEQFQFQESDGSKSKWAKFLSSNLFIPSAAVLLIFFGAAVFLRLMNRHNSNATTNNQTSDGTSRNSATMPPVTTTDTPTSPLETISRRLGTYQNSNVDYCAEVVLFNEGEGTSHLPNGTSTCAVCLEQYHAEEKIKYLLQCGHYFHAQCVDQWLEKNTTCPVCRNDVSHFRITD